MSKVPVSNITARPRHRVCRVVGLISLIVALGLLAHSSGEHPSPGSALAPGSKLNASRRIERVNVLAKDGPSSPRSGDVGPIPQLTQASWSFTGRLNTARYAHTATVLANDNILVVGGESFTDGVFVGLLTSAELYDPATANWTITGSLNKARASHTATLLPNGRVLVVGGDGSTSNISSSELYDPATGTWSVAGNLKFVRVGHTATLLPNGKALIVGGNQGTGQNAEVYDPVSATWSLTGLLNTLRQEFTATLLDNGMVLLTGGVGQVAGLAGVSILDVAELYNPATGTWSLAQALNHKRASHSATLLTSGKVLVAGGYKGFEPLSDLAILDDSLELYDPATGRWRITGNGAYSGTATLLPGGQVLFTGWGSAQLCDPETGTWRATAVPNEARSGHSPVLMSNGRVLVAGGSDGSGRLLDSVEVFDSGLTSPISVPTASAASYHVNGLTAEAIAMSFGSGLASRPVVAETLPLPTELGGTTVKVRDSAGTERLAPLFFVSPAQVNYQIPSGTVVGVASVIITSGSSVAATGTLPIRPVAPGLFSANQSGQGAAAAVALRVRADGSQNYEVVAEFDALQKRYILNPIDLGPESDRVFLILFGTGIRFRSSLSAVVAAIGGEFVEVTFAGALPDFAGLDQVNVVLPRTLVGRGEMEVSLAVDALIANAVRVSVR